MVRIGINASGGDNKIAVVGPAIVRAAQANPNLEIYLYSSYPMSSFLEKNLRVIYCERPSEELRIAFCDMAAGDLDAVITATTSKRLLSNVHSYLEEDIERPGLIAPFPTGSSHKLSYIIDAGATARVTDPNIFAGWARLGSDFLEKQLKIKYVRIGLANIAAERACPEISGINRHLQQFPGYLGYVEPEDFVAGRVDLLLCDGFHGNWTLKWTESFAEFMFDKILETCSPQEASYQKIESLRDKMISYDAHLISPLLGFRGGIVFRVHGAATSEQIAKAFGMAVAKYKLD